jgi:hypothetical protein
LEKSINRGDINQKELNFEEFQRYFNYQGIREYFLPNTEISYAGKKYSLSFINKEKKFSISSKAGSDYKVPKIMYVPAERNFLSTISDAFDVTGLPKQLVTFAEELKKAQKKLKGKPLDLPIKNYSYEYEDTSESSFVLGPGHRVNLLQASSGFQSTIPLYLVSWHLTNLITSNGVSVLENMSVSQSLRMEEEILTTKLDNSLSNDVKQRKIRKIQSKYVNQCFINIVEEPEQNLFPTSQRFMLNSLLKFSNRKPSNKLIITTHSPYIINYLTLAVKAHSLKNKLKFESLNRLDSLRWRLSTIVPLNATIRPESIIIYELDETSGSIKMLEEYHGLPSDDNYLNAILGESNELFAQLLEIQQGL